MGKYGFVFFFFCALIICINTKRFSTENFACWQQHIQAKKTMLFRICVAICLALAVVNARVTKGKPLLTQKLINEINSAQTTWKAGPNKFMSWSEDAIRRLMGVRPDYAQRHKLITPIEHEVPNDLPDNFDARTQWPNCASIKEVRDQGRYVVSNGVVSCWPTFEFVWFDSCGSCWAFGAVEAMTDRICIASQGAKNFHISAEDLVCMLLKFVNCSFSNLCVIFSMLWRMWFRMWRRLSWSCLELLSTNWFSYWW